MRSTRSRHGRREIITIDRIDSIALKSGKSSTVEMWERARFLHPFPVGPPNASNRKTQDWNHYCRARRILLLCQGIKAVTSKPK
jgi:hypothetical protein